MSAVGGGCGGESQSGFEAVDSVGSTSSAPTPETTSLDASSSGSTGGFDETGSGSETTGNSSTDTGDEVPFECDLPVENPTLDPQHWLHPAEPVAGQALTVALQAPAVEPANAPALVAELINRAGIHEVTESTVVGGETLYYITVGGLEPGENCIVIRNGDAVELATKVVAADPGPGIDRGNGVWKVTVNHQWTCDEQPTFGNLLHVRVLDENGAPVEGATVGLGFTDDTVYPVGPDQAPDFGSSEHPKTLTTDGDGRAQLWTPWGEGIRSPVDSKPGLAVYRVWIEGGASDVATEITTGLWEATYDGCNYCNEYAINTWGHWSYTVEFQRAPEATQVCEVGTDHAGQQACEYTHFFHDDARPSCIPVAP